MDSLKQAACDAIDEAAKELHVLSQDLWNNPELKFEEHYAHETITRFLEGKGFAVEKKYKLDTAFRATVGTSDSGPHVAVMCEYDALPGIGHACGHNLIAESGVAAGLGIKAALEKAGKPLGKVRKVHFATLLFLLNNNTTLGTRIYEHLRKGKADFNRWDKGKDKN